MNTTLKSEIKTTLNSVEMLLSSRQWSAQSQEKQIGINSRKLGGIGAPVFSLHLPHFPIIQCSAIGEIMSLNFLKIKNIMWKYSPEATVSKELLAFPFLEWLSC